MWASDCFVFVICFTFSQLPEASVDSKSMWAKFDHVEWLLRLIASSLTYDKGWCGGFLKWGYEYPQIIDFNRIFHYTLSIWGYHWWKPPCQIGWFSDEALESHHGLSLKTREISSDSIPQRHPKETLKPEEHRSSVFSRCCPDFVLTLPWIWEQSMGIISPTLG